MALELPFGSRGKSCSKVLSEAFWISVLKMLNFIDAPAFLQWYNDGSLFLCIVLAFACTLPCQSKYVVIFML